MRRESVEFGNEGGVFFGTLRAAAVSIWIAETATCSFFTACIGFLCGWAISVSRSRLRSRAQRSGRRPRPGGPGSRGFHARHLPPFLWETRPRPNPTVSETWLAQTSLAWSSRTSSGLIITSTLPLASPAPSGSAAFPTRRAVSQETPSTELRAEITRFRYASRWPTVRLSLERRLRGCQRLRRTTHRICETTLDRAVPRRRPRTDWSPCHCPRRSGDTIRQKVEYLAYALCGNAGRGLAHNRASGGGLLAVNGAIARATYCGSTYDMPELLRIKAQRSDRSRARPISARPGAEVDDDLGALARRRRTAGSGTS